MVDSLKNIKLTYFNVNGLGAIARMLLHYTKTPFTNNAIEKSQWPELKPKVEFGFLPQLEIDGKVYTQSVATNIYLAKKLGLMGKDIEDEYNITSVLNCHTDYGGLMAKVLFPSNDYEKSPEVLKANTEAFIAKLEAVIGGLEARYVKSGTKKYYLGDSITLADFFIATALGIFFFKRVQHLVEAPVRKVAPNLSKLADRLVSEDLKSFFESDLFYKDSI
mmetsp:Transcript_3831/g.3907  ORF Transcript_3831/g.3907 Transcript_3831/m.3907 type:complete len:220 (-) Transcript_3831:79-738(-)